MRSLRSPDVNGHWEIPLGGLVFSGLAATRLVAAVSGDFERGLAAQASRIVITPHIDAESGRGSDYVSVTLVMTVAATDVAEALAPVRGRHESAPGRIRAAVR
jgi:hypothetical protein